MDIVPQAIQAKVEAVKKYKKCPYCDIIKPEEDSERFVYANEDFIVLCPFAPRFNYEILILPRRHYLNISELDDVEMENLAKSFQKVLSKLGAMNIPYNFYLHYSPQGENLHFHIEIVPRINNWAGFELATDFNVITAAPEEAARFYKE
ncbi:HIT domain-containing protein [Candidatus Parcubacteria bacterium]|nr:HIT domain-containing protein [Candidatus Parcubacteria bacterium]